ncbi:MAG: transposase [Rhodanobacteraceae bacterium]
MISLFAAEERAAKRDRLGDPLKLLDQAIGFAALAKVVDAKWVLGDHGRGGRPPYPTELMIRLLVVQQLYNLSDDALEYQVLDRASFQRFAGLAHSGRVPDAKTSSVWRERLKRQDLMGDISAAVGQQLAQAGFIARGGQIIDASIVTAPVQHNHRTARYSRCPKGKGAAKMTDQPLARACASPIVSIVRDSSATLVNAAMRTPFLRMTRIRRFPRHRSFADRAATGENMTTLPDCFF